MSKIYHVELKVTAVIEAANELEAVAYAQAEHGEIFLNQQSKIECISEIRSLEDLKNVGGEWSGECLPYGGDENTRLSAILPETSPARDVLTGDLFAGADND